MVCQQVLQVNSQVLFGLLNNHKSTGSYLPILKTKSVIISDWLKLEKKVTNMSRLIAFKYKAVLVWLKLGDRKLKDFHMLTSRCGQIAVTDCTPTFHSPLSVVIIMSRFKSNSGSNQNINS